MDVIKNTIGFALVAIGTLSCASIAIASTATTATEPMQASGGFTLGSAALVALAGVVVAFGKERAGQRHGAGENQAYTREHGRLRTAAQEEYQQ